jgi:hypothetical protein
VVGRDKLLAEPDVRFALLLGAGGSGAVRAGGPGKTSVAVEYAYRQSAEFGVVCQFQADERAVTEKRFGELAERLGVRDL